MIDIFQLLYESDSTAVEAPPDAPYGSYLFGEIRHDVFSEPIPREPDTKEEKHLYAALANYLMFNRKTELNDLIPNLITVGRNGWYKRFTAAPAEAAKLYRILIGLNESAVANLIGAKPSKIGTASNVEVRPLQKDSFTGWTYDIAALERLFEQARFEGDGVLGYCVVCICDIDPNRDAIVFNMDATAKYLNVGARNYQKEILTAGPMMAEKLVYARFDRPSGKNPVPFMLDVVRKHGAVDAVHFDSVGSAVSG